MSANMSRGAAITGWGKCLPPAVLTNADIATFLETSDEWITSRTGIRERRVSHVPLGELMYVAVARALACAGLDGKSDRAHRGRHHQLRRPGAERRLGHPAAHRRRRLRGHGRQHRLHQLPLFPIYRHRDDPDRRREERARDRRRGHLAVHRLERPQHRGAVRRRRRGRGARSHRPRRRAARRAARLLRRVARNPARARHGRGLRASEPHHRQDRVAVRRPGDLQEGRARHGASRARKRSRRSASPRPTWTS